MPSDSIMSSNSIRGGSSDGDEEEPQQLDLLSLYQSDIGHKILSYASGTDLCSIDVLSKQFQGLTTDRWKVVTEERFGMNDGKEGWKFGTALLRPPVFMHLAGDVIEDSGSPRIALNESLLKYQMKQKIMKLK